MAKKKEAPPSNGRKGRKTVERPFPRRTVEDALRIPTALREQNAGNPWPPDQVAAALKIGAKTGGFYYLTAASRDYGFTAGSSKTAEISLTDLGRQVVYPESPEQRRDAIQRAVLSVPTFRGVLEYYKGLNLPEREFLANTLEQKFQLDPTTHDEFLDVLKKNCRFAGLGRDAPSSETEKKTRIAEPKITPADPPEVETLTSVEDRDNRPVCFVAMPFTERDERHPPGFFAEALESLIRPAAEKAGFIVRTANRDGSDVIQSTIVNELLDADLVIADLTEHNPNVLFELGLRMCEEQPVALIRAKGTGQIFDIDHMLRVADYDPCLWPSTVQEDLPRLQAHIEATWAARDTAQSYISLLRQRPAGASVG